MAKSESVWGIDIGNSSLKALRCRRGDQAGQLVAEAFDYIEYPKILSQPGAEPDELVSGALAQFLSRNGVRGDHVAISVSGQSGLARFIKLPPVESKRIPDIVKYEAKQQIPFDLEDVIWDYQQIGGGMEVEGFVLEAEVGLFAMKRDQVFRSLEPFKNAGIDVDHVQLTPLALYNFLTFDQLDDLPPADEYDPEDPPPSYIILSMGTDATDLVITNGYRVWQRSIPLGGNHFTKALTKELKLTFAKAEHLKRNASAAQDPKAVFQAMRPIFNDLLTEIQRSITYFTSIDRSATIANIVTLGNGMKLPGLQRYLAQSLGYEVVRLDSFHNLVGPEVVDAPAFKENLLSFGPSYGLALQALRQSALKTDLLPRELVHDRMIRGKKPWAVAAAAVLLLAFTIGYVSLSRALGSMAESVYGASVEQAEKVISESGSLKSGTETAKSTFLATDEIGQNLVGYFDGRLRWLRLMKAINSCLPSDPPGNRPDEISLRNELHVESFACTHLENLGDWLTARQQWIKTPTEPAAGAPPGAPGAPGAAPAPAAAPQAMASAGVSGPGWVIVLTGYHYHNRRSAVDLGGKRFMQGTEYVRETLIKQLQQMQIQLPDPDNPGVDEFVSMADLGISNPILVNPGQIAREVLVNPNAEGAAQVGSGTMGGMGGAAGYAGSEEEGGLGGGGGGP
ncbi:MAG: type IV pilus assembly protein PilM, partial [Planctomycetes bacterium]|nr:type IV pilus assembly protein PilM [Planctomycetota bacterium]